MKQYFVRCKCKSIRFDNVYFDYSYIINLEDNIVLTISEVYKEIKKQFGDEVKDISVINKL